MQPAKELPQTPADVSGIFDHRQDNSIFVGTGPVTTMEEPGGAPQTTHSGPTVEVVVTNETTIFKDVTMRQFDSLPPDGQQIKQVVKPGLLDEIGQDSVIAVWGSRTGERMIADVLVYELPAGVSKPGPAK